MEKVSKNQTIIISIIAVIATVIAIGTSYYFNIRNRQSTQKQENEQIKETAFTIDLLQGIFVGEGSNEVYVKYGCGEINEEQYLEFTEKENKMRSDWNEETITELQAIINEIIGESNQFYMPGIAIVNKENLEIFGAGYLAAKTHFAAIIAFVEEKISEEQFTIIEEKYREMLSNPNSKTLGDYFDACDVLDDDNIVNKGDPLLAGHPYIF